MFLIGLTFMQIITKLENIKCMDPKWSPILILSLILIAQLQRSAHSLSLPSLLGVFCIGQMLAITRMGEQ